MTAPRKSVLSTSPPAKSWRVTTAARVFVVALAFGQTLSAGSLQPVGMILLALTILAAVTCAIEYESAVGIDRWTPVAEGALSAVLVGAADAPVAPLLVYLALPPVVAGVRHGWVTTANTTLAIGIALTGSYFAAEALDLAVPQIWASLPWLFVGLGTGLLAAWLTRSGRALEESQAPYAAAHRLLSQLRTVSRQLPGGLDSHAVAQRAVDDVIRLRGVDRAVLFVRSSQQTLIPAAEGGTTETQSEAESALAQRCLDEKRTARQENCAAIPLRGVNHYLGAVVLSGPRPWSANDVNDLRSFVDEQSLRLDTALLFDEVRGLATAEERNRLAREIHDGIAQEIASLGYLVDDLSASTIDPEAREAALELRREVTRVVSELRLSIFDLRHGVDEEGGLAGALTEYVREVSAGSNLRVHLLLDEQQTALQPSTKAELLRIAQEAISNVRRHSQALNMWVTLATNGRLVRLQVEDDGVGSAAPRPHHYGLETMRERADRINADFVISPRSHGGTVVTVQTRAMSPEWLGAEHADSRVAHR